MDIYRRIGERIRHARREAGLTQPALAELLDVSKGIVSRWEMGLARPSLDRLDPLAARLGISVEQMLGFAVAEGTGAYRARSVPVWNIGAGAIPDLKGPSSVGYILVVEEEAFAVQGAFYIQDNSFAPYLLEGDIVGIQTAGRPKLGDVVFAKIGDKVIVRRFGGTRGGFVLLPFEIGMQPENVKKVEFLGMYRWLRRPGRVIPRAAGDSK